MYRTASQIEGWMSVIDSIFTTASRTVLPNTTHDGRQVSMLTLRAGSGSGRHGVLLVGGTHARELMNPDLLLELTVDLLVAYDNGDPIVYGGKTWSASTVKLIMETLDIHVVCTSNPDGRTYAMTTDAWWRKNRRDNAGTSCDGVDLNRNLQPLWSTQPGSSCDPCTGTYAGPGAFSEPETKNIKWVLDNRDVHCFVDVHSYSELILYPWGHAPTQTTDSSQRFTTLPTGTCTDVTPEGYAEYMDPVDLQRFQTVAARAVDAIAAVRGRAYTPQAGIDLYATTGTHGDYPYSRHIADPSKLKTYSFTFETGTSFQPTDPEPFKQDAKSGLMAVLQNCICAIDLIGTTFFGGRQAGAGMRTLRDEVLVRTEAGRRWIGLFERRQADLLELILRDRDAGEAVAKLVEAVDEVMDGRAEMTRDHHEIVASLIDRMAEGAKQDRAFRADLDAIMRQAERSVGRGRDDIVEGMLARGPSGKGDRD